MHLCDVLLITDLRAAGSYLHAQHAYLSILARQADEVNRSQVRCTLAMIQVWHVHVGVFELFGSMCATAEAARIAIRYKD